MTDPDPTQTPPLDAALPGSVEAAFRRLRFACPCLQWGPEHGGQCAIPSATKVLRQAIAALTAQNAALVAERDVALFNLKSMEKLNDKVMANERKALAELDTLRIRVYMLIADRDAQTIQARIVALEWVWSQALRASWADLGERIKAELQRLKAQGEAPSDE